jgi:hypothetical protein
VGFCLPVTSAKTKISFGGRNEFNSIGDFLKYIFQYSITLASILTALMIIKGGFSYVLSGGNSQKKSEALSTISKSVTGLLLAITSYAILYAINPNLTTLKEPDSYMLTPLPLGDSGDTCRTAGPELNKCLNKGKPGEYVCRPNYKEGVCNTILKAPGALGAAILMIGPGALDIGGGVILKVGGKVAQTVAKVGGNTFIKLQKAAFVTPIKVVAEKLATAKSVWSGGAETAAKASAEFTEKSINEMANQIAAGVVKQTPSKFGSIVDVAKAASAVPRNAALGTVANAALGGAIFVYAKEIYNYVNPSTEQGLDGKCTLNYKLPQGAMCDVNFPKDCESGICVPINDGTGCWVDGLKFGICSTGENNSICDPQNSTCKTGLKCVKTTVWLGSITGDEINVCTDGNDQSPCGIDSDCKAGAGGTPGKCEKYGNLKLCSITSQPGNEGMPCRDELSTTGGDCNEGLVCQNKDNRSPYFLKCVRPCGNDNECSNSSAAKCKNTTFLQNLENDYINQRVSRYEYDQRIQFYEEFKLKSYCQS